MATLDGGVEHLAGDDGLAAAGGALDPQTQGVHVDVADDLGQAAGQAGETPLRLIDVGVDVGRHLEGLAEETFDHPGPLLVGLLARAQEGVNALRQGVAGAGVDDAARIQRRRVDRHHPVVGTKDQIVDVESPAAAMDVAELLAHVVDGALDLIADVLRGLAVDLDQAVLGLLQAAVLLLDQQDLAGFVDDGEIDLAIDREALVFAGPVDSVKDRVFGGQPIAKQDQRLQLGRMGPGQGEGGDVGGNDAGHGRQAAVERNRRLEQ